jgi:lysophospholipase L1-like esterase
MSEASASRSKSAVRFGAARSLGAIALGTAVGLLVVEGILQVGAYSVWKSAKRRAQSSAAAPIPATLAENARVVLCIGDSFTYGSGASSPEGAYPLQLQRALGESAGEKRSWHVVNAGWPGRNSAETAARLPDLLARTKPDFVVTLVGMNNRWNEADAAAVSNESESWAWRWRTKRLFAIAARAAGDRSASSEFGEIRAALQDPARAAAARDDLLRRRSAIADSADGESVAQLVETLYWAGYRDEAIDAGLRALARLGESAAVHRELVAPLARVGRLSEALQHAHEALRLAPEDADAHRALALALRLSGNPRESVRELARAFAADHDEEMLERQLRRRAYAAGFRGDRLTEAIADVPLERETRARFLDIAEVARTKTESSEDSLPGDLARIARLARESGSRPLFLTYPHSGRPSSIDEAILDAAIELRVPCVDLVPVFDDSARTIPAVELFVADGHCTDRGYAIVAEEVALALRALEDVRR